MRSTALLFALLLLAPLVPFAPAAAQAAEPQARWFGPTGMLEGWHVRIPVSVENPLPRDVVHGVATYDLRLADALIQAGWVTSRKGSSTLLESWEMDPDSVRVVEYRSFAGSAPHDGILVGEVASKAATRLYDTTRPYNNRTQPDLHVEWVMPGVTPANGTRHFFILVDTLANGRKDAPSYAEADMAAIEARGWVGRGTTLYGVAGRLTLVGLENDTRARVEVYSGSRPIPLTSSGEGSFRNPVLLNLSETVDLNLAENGAVVRIVSDRPLVALGYPSNAQRVGGVVPSANGGVLGTEFLVPARGYAVMAVMAGAPALVTTSTGEFLSVAPGSNVAPIQLVDANRAPFMEVVRVRASAPIMMLAWPNATGKTQFPSVHGAPTGSRVVGIPHVAEFCGANSQANGQGSTENCNPAPRPPCTTGNVEYKRMAVGGVLATSLSGSLAIRGRDALRSTLAFPVQSDRVAAQGATLSEGLRSSFEVLPLERTTNLGGAACPLVLHTTKDTRDASFLDQGDIVAWGGTDGTNAVSGAIGSPGGTAFHTFWPSAVIAHHNGTTVIVTQEGKPDVRRTLGKGDLLEVAGTLRSAATIHADKPLVVLPKPLGTGADAPGGAGGWFAGFDDSLRVRQAGTPQYRGYLVSLEPATASTEPMQGLAPPGSHATYKLLVKNLAKDDRGQPVADVVDLLLEPPGEGWSAELSHSTLRLQGGQSAEVTVKVTPPPDAKEGDKTRLAVSAASQGNPRMTDRIQAITTVRASYEVGVWYDRENAPPGKTITLDPEETRDVKVVVKNLAAVPDRVTVVATPTSSEWRAAWGSSPAAITTLDLEPGESRTLTLRLTAPAAKASQTNLEVRATSEGDGSASAKQDATARVRAEVRIALLAEETVVEAAPGTQAVMRVVFENRGNDRVGIRFNTTGALPDGWTRAEVRSGEYAIDELAGIVPGGSVPLDVVLSVPPGASRGDRANVHFFVETLPQFAGDPILRDAIDLLVLAGARHDLAPLDPPSTLSLGLQQDLRAQLSIENGGNGAELLRVVPTDVPAGANVVVGDPARVPVGGRGAVEMTVTFPAATVAGTYRVAADVVAEDGHVVPWTFNVTVPERRAAALAPLGPLQGTAGLAETVRVEVANVGNVELRMPPALAAPPGWTLAWGDAPSILHVGESAVLTLRVQAPRAAASEVYSFAADPSWAAAAPLAWDLRTVALSAQAAHDGAGVAVKLTNAGTGDALDVDVLLVQGTVEVDRVVLQRVPPGATSTAILAPRPGVGGDLRVVVDNGTRYADEPQVLTVSGTPPGREVPAPGLATLALAIVLCALLARRARR